jgi:tripartite-type tricarboxylate transporter receptor subunit TctC
MAEWPDVPTMAEVGVSGMEVVLWTGLLAPVGTPAPILAKLESEVARIVHLPDVADRLKSLSIDPVGDGAVAFAREIAAEIPQWTAVARAAHIPLN